MDQAQELIEAARTTAEALYAGEVVAHRSCGVAVAETFSRPVRAYSVLRRGGLDGTHECGAVRAGELVLAELLGSDDPSGPVPEPLLAAIEEYRERCRQTLDAGPSGLYICNELTAMFTDFQVPPRRRYCTSMASKVAATVAEVALRHGAELHIAPLPTS
ncbi:MAG: hypothetical protein IT204_09410 [Fimbriimonadaceae bacterium]|nr:hypothetical protein [Fimbriimonadaceae bacterium]